MLLTQRLFRISSGRTATRVALILGTLSLPLIAGAANAQIATYSCSVLPATIGTLPPANTCAPTQLGDKLVSYRADLFSISLPPGLPPGFPTPQVDIKYSWIPGGFGNPQDNDFSNDAWLFEVGAATGAAPFVGPFTLTYGYDVTIVSGPDLNLFEADGEPWFFDRVGLQVDANPIPIAGQRVIKAVTGTGVEEVFEFALENVSGDAVGPAFNTLSGNYKKITITDSLNIPEGANLTSVSNAWTQRTQVPGPLPIMGAAAAFSFSRRIRSRIKSYKLS